ncbi:MAG: GntR family transcriptional regulator [Lentisphaeria bacterium]
METLTKSKNKRGQAIAQRQHLADILHKAFEDGTYQAGMVLPTEADIMGKHGMSRHNVRLVLDVLLNEGLIEKTPGRGTVVTGTLQHSKSTTITYVLQSPKDWLCAGVMQGCNDFFNGSDYRFEFMQSGDLPTEFDACIDRLIDTPPAGVIIMPLPWHESYEWVFKLKQAKIPFVTVDSRPFGSNCNSVEMDNRQGGYLAGKHLIEQGYKHLFCVGYKSTGHTYQLRFEGFMDAVKESIEKIETCMPLCYKLTNKAERDHIHPWDACQEFWREMVVRLNKSMFPAGVFAGSDIEAYGIMRACDELGIEIGKTIGVIGFDDRDLAIMGSPLLSSIRQSPETIGLKAAERLKTLIEEGDSEYQHIKLKTELIIRESSILK